MSGRIRTRGVTKKDKLKTQRSVTFNDRSHFRRIAPAEATRKTGYACPACLWYGKNELEFKAHWKAKHGSNANAIKTAHEVSNDIFHQ